MAGWFNAGVNQLIDVRIAFRLIYTWSLVSFGVTLCYMIYGQLNSNKYAYNRVTVTGSIVNERYGFLWFIQALSAIRVLVPLAGLYALVEVRVRGSKLTHHYTALLAWLLELLVLVVLWFQQLNCNTSTASPSDACADARWCCVYQNTTVGLVECPNGGGATCEPDVTTNDLGWDGAFSWMVYANYFFLLSHFIHLILNGKLRVYMMQTFEFVS
jgi:hypothetical protein